MRTETVNYCDDCGERLILCEECENVAYCTECDFEECQE